MKGVTNFRYIYMCCIHVMHACTGYTGQPQRAVVVGFLRALLMPDLNGLGTSSSEEGSWMLWGGRGGEVRREGGREIVTYKSSGEGGRGGRVGDMFRGELLSLRPAVAV